jgi:arylsulfatase A-like enzyme
LDAGKTSVDRALPGCCQFVARELRMSVGHQPLRWRARTGLAMAAAVLALVATACTSTFTHAQPAPPKSAPTAPPSPSRPNIVYVLTDDLSSDLLPYMPHVAALAAQGMTFTNYTVADSECCPSRASIFTGDYPHTTGVYINEGSAGGFEAFNHLGNAPRSFAIPLRDRGYQTAFMGKYLNAYYASYPAPKALGDWAPPEVTYVPPGWDEWDAVGLGYKQYNYTLNHDHKVISHGTRPQDYLNTVLERYGRRFIKHSADEHTPFFLEVASFSPHTPNTPAPQDAHKFARLTAPTDPAFGHIPAHAPHWLAMRKPLTPGDLKLIDQRFRARVRAVQSVDRMVAGLEAKLAATDQLNDTVFVFNSDNGYHEGQYDLLPGKLTAFDTDVNVPLIVTGPGIAAGSVNNDVVQNVDLAPTFEQLAGATPSPAVEGHSLVPLLHGEQVPWRQFALIEHRGPDVNPHDPDVQTLAEGNPPSYEAIRSPRFTYVRYVTGETEYYDRARDPYELDNLAPSLSTARQQELTGWVNALHNCSNGAQCWQAGQPSSY